MIPAQGYGPLGAFLFGILVSTELLLSGELRLPPLHEK